MRVEDVIQKPLATEKGARGQQMSNEYQFAVHLKATKTQVKDAVRKLFKVKVEKVRTIVVPGRLKRYAKGFGRTPDWKKAIVRLKAGEAIKLFEGA